jgi:hypothetical protein
MKTISGKKTFSAHQNYASRDPLTTKRLRSQAHQKPHQAPVRWQYRLDRRGTRMKSIAESMHNFDRKTSNVLPPACLKCRMRRALHIRRQRRGGIQRTVSPAARGIPGACQQISGRPQRDASPVAPGVQGERDHHGRAD